MALKVIDKKMDTLALFQKRIEIMIGAKLKDKNRIQNAIEVQDELRKKTKGWNGVAEIRKWRDRR
jgi:hypothetical protein